MFKEELSFGYITLDSKTKQIIYFLGDDTQMGEWARLGIWVCGADLSVLETAEDTQLKRKIWGLLTDFLTSKNVKYRVSIDQEGENRFLLVSYQSGHKERYFTFSKKVSPWLRILFERREIKLRLNR